MLLRPAGRKPHPKKWTWMSSELRLVVLPVLFAAGAHGQISFNAAVLACGNVEVTGGFTLSGHQNVAPTWDWGDGQKTRSFFPTRYQYSADGTYTITGSIIVDGVAVISATQRVVIAGAQAPGCDAAIYVDRPKAVLKGGITSLQLAVFRVTNAGQSKPADPTTLTFTSSNPSLVQVSRTGLLTSV